MGTFAVQIAKFYGAEVTGVDSTEKLDMLISLGADHVIDYTKEDYTKTGHRYDFVLDVVAYRSVFDYRRVLRPTGVFVIVGGSFSTFLQIIILGTIMSRQGGKTIGLNTWQQNSKEDLAFLAELFENNQVIPVIDRRYRLNEVPEAFRYLEGGHALGKIVITIEQNNKT
jgi:NADPH:quinone reductase-like Zn-dependent oxidoreductase